MMVANTDLKSAKIAMASKGQKRLSPEMAARAIRKRWLIKH